MRLLPRGWYPAGWDTYFHRCITEGYCRDIQLKNELNLDIPHVEGKITLYPTEGIPVSYTSCTGCRRPISHLTQAKLNKMFGYELKANVDDDFMKALEGF